MRHGLENRELFPYVHNLKNHTSGIKGAANMLS